MSSPFSTISLDQQPDDPRSLARHSLKCDSAVSDRCEPETPTRCQAHQDRPWLAERPCRSFPCAETGPSACAATSQAWRSVALEAGDTVEHALHGVPCHLPSPTAAGSPPRSARGRSPRGSRAPRRRARRGRARSPRRAAAPFGSPASPGPVPLPDVLSGLASAARRGLALQLASPAHCARGISPCERVPRACGYLALPGKARRRAGCCRCSLRGRAGPAGSPVPLLRRSRR
jgi:hypothetical protein